MSFFLPRTISSKSLLFIFATIFVVTLPACQKKPNYGYIEGQTMGTSYHILYETPMDSNETLIKARIDKRLEEINNSMSTYQDNSTITTFNQMPANQSIQIDKDFINVLNDSKTVYQQSGGTFNPTVMPLVELWGFGRHLTVDRLQSPPTPQEIQTARTLIDFDSVVLEGNQLHKNKEGVELDFSAVAKGYAVDVIANVLHEEYQVNNYMVEIGGEVATSGVNEKQQPWQIAIDTPILNSTVSGRQVIAAIRQPLDKQKQGSLHLATSGNYRNSVVFEGIRYSHTINPLTGNPIRDGAPSVTVAAQTVSLADAWATALTAMPYDQAIELAKSQNLAALFVMPRPKNNQTIENNELKNIPKATDWQVIQTPTMEQLRAGQPL